MKNVMIVVLIALLGVVSFRSVDLSEYSMQPQVQEKVLVNANYEQYKPLIVTAFDKVEKQFLVDKPDEEVVEGIDPDPAKCICKGTGLLPTDGAVRLYCKYHGNKSSDDRVSAMQNEIESLKAKLFKDDKCNCTPEECAMGECSCTDCKCHVKTTVQKKTNLSSEYIRKDRPKNTVEKTDYQVVMFTAEWCAPCKAFKLGPLKDLYEKVFGLEVSKSASADIRVLDVDAPGVMAFYESMRGEDLRLPMFVEIENNTVVSRSSGTSYFVNGVEKPKDVNYLLKTYDFEEKR